MFKSINIAIIISTNHSFNLLINQEINQSRFQEIKKR